MFAIKSARERAGLTQQQVADYLGIKKGRYGDWERETREINLRDAVALADLFGCTLDELAGREPRAYQGLPPGVERITRSWQALNDRGRAKLEEHASDLAANPANTSAKSGGVDTPQGLTA